MPSIPVSHKKLVLHVIRLHFGPRKVSRVVYGAVFSKLNSLPLSAAFGLFLILLSIEGHPFTTAFACCAGQKMEI